jgi:hypothetical protein
LGVVSGTWTRVPLCPSRCGDRQEQEGHRVPAHSLVQLNLRQGLARGRTASDRGDARCLAGLAEVGEDAVDRSAIGDSGDQSHRLPRAGVPQRDDLHSRRAKGPIAASRPPPRAGRARAARRASIPQKKKANEVLDGLFARQIGEDVHEVTVRLQAVGLGGSCRAPDYAEWHASNATASAGNRARYAIRKAGSPPVKQSGPE